MPPNDPPSDPRAVVRPSGDLLEGTPYRLLAPLGRGGMGEVFEAEHRSLGHRVVIKVLRDALAARPDMRDRMRVEGQALARIRHPNLVMVTDFGETKTGHQFIVMERLVGASLHDRLQEQAIVPIEEAVEIARQMLLGLHAAHEAGLVHRDVKPDNAFLCATEDTRPLVKMLDFGIVKIAQVGSDPRTPLPLVVPTGEGVSLGTPRYFSPEQARRETDLDLRCDVYSVGLVLYEMIAGQHPFEGSTSIEAICRAHAIEQAPLPSALRSQWIPPELDHIVMRALAKPREERFQTALAFAEELVRFLVSIGTDPTAFGGPKPVFAGVPDARSFAEAPTSPAVEMGSQRKALDAPMETDSTDASEDRSRSIGAASRDPVSDGSGSFSMDPTEPIDLRAAPRKLSDAPVMIDHLVERALAMRKEGALPRVPERASSSSSVAITDTAPMQIGVTPAPVTPGKGAIGDTEPMRDLAAMVPPAAEPVPPAARASVPDTAPMFDVASLTRQVPASNDPGSTAPVLSPDVARSRRLAIAIVAALLLIAAIIVLLLRLSG